MSRNSCRRAVPSPALTPALPGRGRTLRFIALATLAYGLFLAAMAASVRGGDRVAVALIGLEGLTLAVVLPLVSRGRLERRFLRRHESRELERMELPELAARLTASGVRRLIVLPSSKRIGSAFRRGGTGYVALHAALLRRNDSATRFAAAHELGHVARADTLRRMVVVAYATNAWGAALAAALYGGQRPALLWLAPLGYVAVLVAFNWARELDYDRIAASGVGRDGAVLFFSLMVQAYRRAVAQQATWPRRGVVWLGLRLDLLVHPPLRLRVALARRWRGYPAWDAGPS